MIPFRTFYVALVSTDHISFDHRVFHLQRSVVPRLPFYDKTPDFSVNIPYSILSPVEDVVPLMSTLLGSLCLRVSWMFHGEFVFLGENFEWSWFITVVQC